MIRISETVSATPWLSPVFSSSGLRSFDSRSRAEGGGKEAGQRDADLHRGEEPVRVGRQLGDRLATLASVGQLLDLAVAQRDQRQLGGHEDALDDDQDQDQRDVEQNSAHRGSDARVYCLPGSPLTATRVVNARLGWRGRPSSRALVRSATPPVWIGCRARARQPVTAGRSAIAGPLLSRRVPVLVDPASGVVLRAIRGGRPAGHRRAVPPTRRRSASPSCPNPDGGYAESDAEDFLAACPCGLGGRQPADLGDRGRRDGRAQFCGTSTCGWRGTASPRSASRCIPAPAADRS